MGGWLFFGIIFGVVFGVVALYNGLVSRRNLVGNSFSQIDVQLQRRHDLIPSLIKTARAYMTHEQETLTRVTEARQQAVGMQELLRAAPKNPAALEQLAAAERVLSSSLSRLMAVVEQYPDLKADQLMQQLMEELSSTEDRIGFARQAYNDHVMMYNNACQMFPSNMIAGAFSFKPLKQLVLVDQDARQAPAVSFA